MAVEHLRITKYIGTPLICTALAAAIGFYFLALFSYVIVWCFLFLALAIFYFLYVYSSINKRQSRILKQLVNSAAAITFGLVIGFGSSAAGRTDAAFALSEDTIAAVEGVLLEDPREISGDRAMALVALRRCAGKSGERATASGQITVFFSPETAEALKTAGRGTTIFTEGRLRRSDTGHTFSAASLYVVKPAPGLEKYRTRVRLNLINRFNGGEWGGLALALLLGIRDNLDSSLASMYRNAGCSYILALSGMHLAVLAALIAFLLKPALGLKPASVAGAILVILYCLLVGPLPSLYRAALMYLLGVIAIVGFFPREPVAILSLSFLIQIILFPAAGYSISFILSYLALLGILMLSPPIQSLFSGKIPGFLLMPLSASCAAFLATAGITANSFGVLAPVGIIAGLALVPLTTVFMIGALIWLIFDIIPFTGSLANFIAVPLSLVYQLMEKIITIASRVPRIKSSNLFVVLIISIFISALVIAVEYRQNKKRLQLLPFK